MTSKLASYMYKNYGIMKDTWQIPSTHTAAVRGLRGTEICVRVQAGG